VRSKAAIGYALLGLVLALGSPLGWLVIAALGNELPFGPVFELRSQPGLYLYLFAGTAVVFTLFGATLGTLVDRLSALAVTDALTGLHNARDFHERLSIEQARSQRSGHPVSLIVGDIDHFKMLNDRRGHAVGDKVLEGFAGRLAGTVRRGDLPFRIGGEEFAVICPGASADEALQVAERIRIAIAAAPLAGEAVTASFGVAQDGSSGIFVAADAALYAAKGGGRNQVKRAFAE
jgi:diguanylate cyclase (GGDEF)-like protein